MSIDDQLSNHSRDITNIKDALRDLQWRVECLESLNAAREPSACEAVASPTYAKAKDAEIARLQADLAAAKEGYRLKRNDIEILLDYFRNDLVGSRYGTIGDGKGWSTCQCAVEAMKELSGDWHKAIIERNQMIAERDAALARAEAAEKELRDVTEICKTGLQTWLNSKKGDVA